MLVCDGFLKDPRLLEQLRDEHMWKSLPAYNWWDGWWRSAPANPQELTIQRVWQGQIAEAQVAGFEYWFNDYSVGGGLKWHRDCDEALRAREGRHITPMIGNVFYVVVEDVIGGLLELSNCSSLYDVEFSELERIQPVANRLVIFDPSNWHRVTRLAQGRRLAFQANLWSEKPSTFALGDHVDKKFQPIP